jgi:hypothetical protein
MGREGNAFDLFSSRRRIRRWRSLSGAFHLLTVATLVLSALWLMPRFGRKSALALTEELAQRHQSRQLLLETLDRLARYQRYFHELNGRYTRDLSRLSLPSRLSGGDRAQLEQDYEISELETHQKRFHILATGLSQTDRVTIDEGHRINANFVLPPPSRAYLLDEAERLLRLRGSGEKAEEGLYARYWQISGSSGGEGFVALGIRNPVLGEKRQLSAATFGITLFSSVSEAMKSRFSPRAQRVPAQKAEATKSSVLKEQVEARDIRDWLDRARMAQHVFKRERGTYARRWEDLDLVSDFRFSERIRASRNVRVQPIAVKGNGSGFELTIEGTAGDLLGEQFSVDESGAVRQVRYTEALIRQLQESTEILENTFRFQINSVNDDPAQRTHP